MTYSLCVREQVAGADAPRFGVAAATRLPAVGSVCPHVSEQGAVATAGVTDADLGLRSLADLAAGRRIDDVVATRAADAPTLQIHGVDAHATAAHTGADCRPVATHASGDGYSVAGTSLADDEVLAALAQGYRDNERDAPLVRRLITALAAAERAGGDRRTDLPVGSAAVVVTTPGSEPEPLYHDLRVDANESPVAELRETYRRAKHGYEAALDRYQTENS
ncbi:DUF1028 domain-containing protein [Haloplanus halobius]|uniref:DUF1028 domain-containing protein n=1 Tax=Haloplanus halobius TaxID=2934938 RepID=UPI00200F152B